MEKFISKFVELLDETAPNSINEKTVFKDLDEWSSLMALSVIAMVDDEYGVTIGADIIKQSSTIEDLYNAVMARV